MFLSVIIPAFNEEARLPTTLTATHDFLSKRFPGESELLVVDDGSRDGTAALTRQFAERHTDIPIRLLEYGGNRGKGYAVRYGMTHAAGDWRLFCDADLATPVEEFDVVFDIMKRDATLIGIGSRPLRESHLLVHQPWYREMLGRGFNSFVQLFAVGGIRDTQCGFKIFSADAAYQVFSRAKLDGFIFDAEALYIAHCLGYAVSEVPIRWSHKAGSKVSIVRDGAKMVRDLMRIRRLHRALKKNAPLISATSNAGTKAR